VRCGQAVVATSDANVPALPAREGKRSREVGKRVGHSQEPGDVVATGSRRGVAESVASRPRGSDGEQTSWEEEDPDAPPRSAGHFRAQMGAVDAAPRSRDEAFWWRCHALDTACVGDTRDSRQYGQNRARGAFHRVLGVVLVGRGWLPVDSGACHWVEAQSALLPGFPHELRVPTAGVRKRVLPVKARRWVGRQREPREGKPPFEPLQTP
jgi:hypothetical protein